MTEGWAWYNENDEAAAAWLEELIREGLIANGVVDRRSIVDVRPHELAGFSQCHFFAGIGGWSLALRRAGWPDRRKVWTGSCPCQPFSAAGKRLGFDDDRHLWPYWRYLIAIGQPPVVFGEQVASAAAWLGLVRGDMEAMEYAVGAIPIEAASAGADHLRDRYWFVAQPEHGGCEGWQSDRPGAGAALSPSKAGLANPFGGAAQRRGEPGVVPRAPGGIETEGNQRQWSGDAAGGGGEGMRDVADADQFVGRFGNEQPAGQQPQSQFDSGTCLECKPSVLGDGYVSRTDTHLSKSASRPAIGESSERIEWVVGADGKARRVKSGIRLLADGFPCRVDLLRGLGNAIDPRPAAAFITAAMSSLDAAE